MPTGITMSTQNKNRTTLDYSLYQSRERLFRNQNLYDWGKKHYT